MSNNKRRASISGKMVLLGDAAVGKSSIVLRLTKNSFSEFGESTIGAAYVTTSIETETAVVKFELWYVFISFVSFLLLLSLVLCCYAGT